MIPMNIVPMMNAGWRIFMIKPTLATKIIGKDIPIKEITELMKSEFETFFHENGILIKNSVSKTNSSVSGIINSFFSASPSQNKTESETLKKLSFIDRILSRSRIKNDKEYKEISENDKVIVKKVSSIESTLKKTSETILPTDYSVEHGVFGKPIKDIRSDVKKTAQAAVYTVKNVLAGVVLAAMAVFSFVTSIIVPLIKGIIPIVAKTGKLLFDFITTPAGFAVTMILFAWIKKFGLLPVWDYFKSVYQRLKNFILSDSTIQKYFIDPIMSIVWGFNDWVYKTIISHIPIFDKSYEDTVAKQEDEKYNIIQQEYSRRMKLVGKMKIKDEEKIKLRNKIIREERLSFLEWRLSFVRRLNSLGIMINESSDSLQDLYSRKINDVDRESPYKGAQYGHAYIVPSQSISKVWLFDENGKQYPPLEEEHVGATIAGKIVILSNLSDSEESKLDIINQLIKQGGSLRDAEDYWEHSIRPLLHEDKHPSTNTEDFVSQVLQERNNERKNGIITGGLPYFSSLYQYSGMKPLINSPMLESESELVVPSIETGKLKIKNATDKNVKKLSTAYRSVKDIEEAVNQLAEMYDERDNRSKIMDNVKKYGPANDLSENNMIPVPVKTNKERLGLDFYDIMKRDK
jgi:hypothetical protein